MGFADIILGQQRGVSGLPKVPITAPPGSGPGSGIAPANLPTAITGKPQNPYVPGPCNVNSQSGVMDINFITVVSPSGDAEADHLVQLAVPARKFFIASVIDAAEANSLYFHLLPIKNVYAATTISPTGTENWFPWNPANATGEPRSVIRLAKKVTFFYLDIGHESGGGNVVLTIGYGDDVDIYVATGGLLGS
jgi:hypothetical protein